MSSFFTITNVLMIFQAMVSVLLIITVLLQFGKGAEAGLFSSGGADAMFTGSQKGNILSKTTIVLSILFIGNSLLLAKIQSKSSGKSLLDDVAPIARPLNNDAAEEQAKKKAQETKEQTPAEEKNTK